MMQGAQQAGADATKPRVRIVAEQSSNALLVRANTLDLLTIEKMLRVLADSTVFGVQTNIPYLIEILQHQEFRTGHMTTRFIETYFAEGLPALNDEVQFKIWATAINKKLKQPATSSSGVSLVHSPWTSFWRGV